MGAADAVNAADGAAMPAVNDLITKKISDLVTMPVKAPLTTNLRLWLTMKVNPAFNINVRYSFSKVVESATVSR